MNESRVGLWGELSAAARCEVNRRWTVATGLPSVSKLIKQYSAKYSSGFESRIDPEDLEQDAYVYLWQTCFSKDPTLDSEYFERYFRRTLSHLLVDQYVRKNKRQSSNVVATVLESELDNGQGSLDAMAGGASNPADEVMLTDLLDKIRTRVRATGDPKLARVYLTHFVATARHPTHLPVREWDDNAGEVTALEELVQEQERDFIAKRGWATARVVPVQVLASAAKVTVREYRQCLDKIRRLVLELLAG